MQGPFLKPTTTFLRFSRNDKNQVSVITNGSMQTALCLVHIQQALVLALLDMSLRRFILMAEAGCRPSRRKSHYLQSIWQSVQEELIATSAENLLKYQWQLQSLRFWAIRTFHGLGHSDTGRTSYLEKCASHGVVPYEENFMAFGKDKTSYHNLQYSNIFSGWKSLIEQTLMAWEPVELKDDGLPTTSALLDCYQLLRIAIQARHENPDLPERQLNILGQSKKRCMSSSHVSAKKKQRPMGGSSKLLSQHKLYQLCHSFGLDPGTVMGDYVTDLRGKNFPSDAKTITWNNGSETVLPWVHGADMETASLVSKSVCISLQTLTLDEPCRKP
jgi:hypothetical protein